MVMNSDEHVVSSWLLAACIVGDGGVSGEGCDVDCPKAFGGGRGCLEAVLWVLVSILCWPKNKLPECDFVCNRHFGIGLRKFCVG